MPQTGAPPRRHGETISQRFLMSHRQLPNRRPKRCDLSTLWTALFSPLSCCRRCSYDWCRSDERRQLRRRLAISFRLLLLLLLLHCCNLFLSLSSGRLPTFTCTFKPSCDSGYRGLFRIIIPHDARQNNKSCEYHLGYCLQTINLRCK